MNYFQDLRGQCSNKGVQEQDKGRSKLPSSTGNADNGKHMERRRVVEWWKQD